MCERCEGGDGRLTEITEDNYGDMVHETTHVALQAAAAHANGWFDAARGFMADMSATWGGQGMVRMAYVWGAARYFLPSPPELAAVPGHQEMRDLARPMLGEDPPPGVIAKAVAQADQLAAACDAIAEASSKGDVEGVTRVLGEHKGDHRAMSSLLLMLMSNAGIRLRHSRDAGAQMGYDLFMAHIHADLPEVDEGGDSDGGTA